MKILMLLMLVGFCNLYSQHRYEIKCRNDVFVVSLQELKNITPTIAKKQPEVIKNVCNDGGISYGLPYCQATQYATFVRACRKLNLEPKKHIPIPRSGLAQSSFTFAKANGKQTKYTAKVGDLLVWRKGNTTSGHVDRITDIGVMGWVITIGGNTMDDKGNNGIFYKKRNIKHPASRVLLVRGLVGFSTRSAGFF